MWIHASIVLLCVFCPKFALVGIYVALKYRIKILRIFRSFIFSRISFIFRFYQDFYALYLYKASQIYVQCLLRNLKGLSTACVYRDRSVLNMDCNGANFIESDGGFVLKILPHWLGINLSSEWYRDDSPTTFSSYHQHVQRTQPDMLNVSHLIFI